MATINNMQDLQTVVNKYIIKAMELTRDEIFEVVSSKVSEYYKENVFAHAPHNKPDYYKRTGKLMESLTASHVTKNDNGYEFHVGWDDDYLTMRYSGGWGGTHLNGLTGLQVLQAFDSGTHGYTVKGEHNYFQEALEELNSKYGSISNLFKHNCKKVGLPIL